jgi:hypothetical protein
MAIGHVSYKSLYKWQSGLNCHTFETYPKSQSHKLQLGKKLSFSLLVHGAFKLHLQEEHLGLLNLFHITCQCTDLETL